MGIETSRNSYIEGKRVILRRMKISDANEKYLSWMLDPDINQYLETRFKKWDLPKLRDYVRGVLGNRRCLFWAIIHRKSRKHIGNIKIGPVVLPHHFADIGIIIGDKSFWGKGLGTESLKLAKAYCFKKLRTHKLIAGVYSDNTGSIKIFKKSGFSVEGIRKKQYSSGGKYVDAILFGCLNNNLGEETECLKGKR